jgi:hypothetical protein
MGGILVKSGCNPTMLSPLQRQFHKEIASPPLKYFATLGLAY